MDNSPIHSFAEEIVFGVHR